MNITKANSRKAPLLSLIVLLILPTLTILTGRYLTNVAGPSWLGENLDPTYLYLMNSLNVANFHRPYYTDHPGTPVQTTGALVIRIINAKSNRAATAQEVLRDPERYVRIINGLLVVLTGFSALIAGCLALVAFRSVPLALLVQATPFVSATTLQGLTQLRPEPVLIGFSILISGVVLFAMSEDDHRRQKLYAIVLGALLGVALASKINFLPVALLPLVVLRSWKDRLVLVATSAAAFLVSILPILNRELLHQMLSFIVNAAGHTGRYGSGQAGIIDPKQYLTALVALVRGDLLFFLIVLTSVVVLILSARLQLLKRNMYRCLLGATAAEIFQLLLVAKHPAGRYLIPALSLIGLNLAILMYALEQRLRGAWKSVALILAFLVICIFQIPASKNLVGQLRADANRQMAAYESLHRDYDGTPVATYYTASSPTYALAFGMGYSGNLYGPILQTLYPNQFFYNPWTGRFSNFAGPVDVATVKGAHDWFILRGCSLSDPDFKVFLPPKPIPDNIKIEPLSGTDIDRPGLVDCEAIYKATISSSY